ncbi:C-X-C motif chemokine 13-like [Rhinoraja longicauda]
MNCGATVTILLLFGHCAALSQVVPVDEDEAARCRCPYYRKNEIPGYCITQIDIFPRSERCFRTEIIARINPRYNKMSICVERTAPWLKILIEDLLANTE